MNGNFGGFGSSNFSGILNHTSYSLFTVLNYFSMKVLIIATVLGATLLFSMYVSNSLGESVFLISEAWRSSKTSATMSPTSGTNAIIVLKSSPAACPRALDLLSSIFGDSKLGSFGNGKLTTPKGVRISIFSFSGTRFHQLWYS